MTAHRVEDESSNSEVTNSIVHTLLSVRLTNATPHLTDVNAPDASLPEETVAYNDGFGNSRYVPRAGVQL